MMMKTRNLFGLLTVVLFTVAALFMGRCDDLGGEWGKFSSGLSKICRKVPRNFR